MKAIPLLMGICLVGMFAQATFAVGPTPQLSDSIAPIAVPKLLSAQEQFQRELAFILKPT